MSTETLCSSHSLRAFCDIVNALPLDNTRIFFHSDEDMFAVIFKGDVSTYHMRISFVLPRRVDFEARLGVSPYLSGGLKRLMQDVNLFYDTVAISLGKIAVVVTALSPVGPPNTVTNLTVSSVIDAITARLARWPWHEMGPLLAHTYASRAGSQWTTELMYVPESGLHSKKL
jgi:hypothetical protein